MPDVQLPDIDDDEFTEAPVPQMSVITPSAPASNIG